ncbi:ankyrin-repeat protein [Murmansk poxvirus]|uniref:Ankyrin-repeat protein n=1 Tax=Murmansk poxvirus TaxID=2025359 RepID=A0A223FN18_9POXV|nr:ankyrin-repeat protein [Murmansk poxvirus]AST09385.1 ankyrin-repeat protein [Murmansk poxvirus]
MDVDCKSSLHDYLQKTSDVDINTIKHLLITDKNKIVNGRTALHEYLYNNSKTKFSLCINYINYNNYYDYKRCNCYYECFYYSDTDSDEDTVDKYSINDKYEFYDETQDPNNQLVSTNIKLLSSDNKDYIFEYYGDDEYVKVNNHLETKDRVYGRPGTKWNDIWEKHHTRKYTFGKEYIDNLEEDNDAYNIYNIYNVGHVIHNRFYSESDKEYVESITKDEGTQVWEKKSELDRYMESYSRHRYSKNSVFKGYSDKVRKNDLNMEVIKLLVSSYKDLLIKDDNGKCPLIMYFRRVVMNLEMIDVINTYLSDNQRSYILHLYLMYHKNFDYPFFRKLVLTNKHCLNNNYIDIRNKHYGTPLHILAYNKRLITPNYIKLLVYNGNDINGIDNEFMNTPLHCYLAIFKYHNCNDVGYYNEIIIDTFIELGADLTIPNAANLIPVIYCIYKNNRYYYPNTNFIKIIRKLLLHSKHADPSLFRDRVMHDFIICHYIDIECLDIIRSLDGFDINGYFKGKTVLHNVITTNYIDIAKYLLDHGADMSLKTDDGKTVFEIALCNYSRLNWISFFISRLPPKEVANSLTIHFINFALMNVMNCVWQNETIIKYLLLLCPSFYSEFKSTLENKINQCYNHRNNDGRRYENDLVYVPSLNKQLNIKDKKKYSNILDHVERCNHDISILKSINISKNITLYNSIFDQSKLPLYIKNIQPLSHIIDNIYYTDVKKAIYDRFEKYNNIKNIINYIRKSQISYLSVMPDIALIKILQNLELYNLNKLQNEYISDDNDVNASNITTRSIATQT